MMMMMMICAGDNSSVWRPRLLHRSIDARTVDVVAYVWHRGPAVCTGTDTSVLRDLRKKQT